MSGSAAQTGALHLARVRAPASAVSVGLGVLLVAAVTSSLSWGAVPMDARELLRTLLVPLTGEGSLDPLQVATVWSLRLPRTLLAVEVGAALAVAGLSLQALFRNPLAEPSLMGTSMGAALGAVAAIVIQPTLPGFVPAGFNVTLAAFCGGLAATLLAQWLGSAGRNPDTTRLLLGGIAVNAIAGTGVGLFMYVASDAQLRSITFWNLGSFAGASWPVVATASVPMLVGLALLLLQTRRLNLLLLGEREAGHLGVRVARLKLGIVMAVSLAVAGAVSAVGTIGFVGLVVPAALRLALGPGVTRLALPSVLLGAALLALADTVSRTVALPAEIPVGLTTSLIGAPVFVWLLRRGGAS